jgi:hypothetical protein
LSEGRSGLGKAQAEGLMPDFPTDIAELDGRIAIARENLRELVEQAAAYSGAADEDLMSQRIAEQEALLDRLVRWRDELLEKRQN